MRKSSEEDLEGEDQEESEEEEKNEQKVSGERRGRCRGGEGRVIKI